mgnify:FL=1
MIYEINNLRLRKIVISILVIVNISHLYYELNYKTFYKPEVSKILTLIIASLEQGYTKNIYIHEETNPPDFGNYVMRTNNFLNNDFKILKNDKSLHDKGFWLICYNGNNSLNCPHSNIEGKFKTEITLRKKRIIAEYKKKVGD